MMATMQRQHELNAKNLTFMRAEQWEELLQKQKITRQEGEFQEEEKLREIRKRRIEDEYEDERKRREYALQKEMQHDQMEQLRAMEAMNQQRDEFEANLLLKTEAQRHQQKVDELNIKKGMSAEALIATADAKNAEVLGNVEMSKHESQAQSKIREEAAQRERELQEQRLRDAQASNATTLDTIKEITGQAFGAMGQVAGRSAPTPGSTDPAVPRVIVCSGCRTENQPPAKFCSNCGKGL